MLDFICRCLCLLVILHGEHSKAIHDIDLQRLPMFINRQTELVLPLSRKYRCSGIAGLLALLKNSLVDLCIVHVKDKEILAICTDQLAEQLIALVGIPAHKLHDLCKEQAAGNLLRLLSALVRA